MTEINKATYHDKYENLSKEVRALSSEGEYYYLKDFDEQYAYFSDYNDCYRVSYTMSENGAVTLGEDKQLVIQETTYTEIDKEESLEKSITENVIGWLEKHFKGSQKESSPTETVPVIKQFQEEQMIAVEPLYIAPMEIDGHNDSMTEPEIRKLVKSFNEALEGGTLSLKESHRDEVEYFTVEKCWVNEVDCFIGDHFVPEGQPLVKTKFHDKDKWEARKNGELLGLSIEGAAGSVEFIEVEDE